nr:Chain s, Nuclear GTP-binding protein NUG1 [Saccharomyces cerevisiae BY4741]
MRVRKRQ